MYNFSFNLFFIISLTLSHLFAEFDYVTVPPGADPSVSAEDGGNGFDKIGAQDSVNPNVSIILILNFCSKFLCVLGAKAAEALLPNLTNERSNKLISS